ncbi:MULTISPECIES: ISAzo13-like element transposase-related protein [Methylobacter]
MLQLAAKLVQGRYRFVYWYFYAKHGSFKPRISASRQCVSSNLFESRSCVSPLTKELIERATTNTGLTVVACILNKVYETKRKVVGGFKESMRILFDDILGQWNYVATPKNGHLEVTEITWM